MYEKNKNQRMPVIFVGHGSPVNAVEDNEFTQGWKEAARTLPEPVAILSISAHWETSGTFVTAMDKPKTIHDFGGFPGNLYEVQYPAPGNRGLAEEISGIIKKTTVNPDYKWGLDHGSWSVLKNMYPEADIPVIQFSLDYSKPARFHYELSKELSPLRDKGVLIMGSGNIVHNLRLVNWSNLDKPGEGYDWAIEANDKIKSFILSGDHDSLIDYHLQGKAINLAVPTPEHFLPLLYILSLKEDGEKISFFNDKPVGGSLTMTSLRIG